MLNKLVIIQRGESLPFKFDRGGATIDTWTCQIKVKQRPEDTAVRMQAVTITFDCGFGTEANVPAEIKEAILLHATAMQSNRGDCDDASCANAVPAIAKAIYLQNRIENM